MREIAVTLVAGVPMVAFPISSDNVSLVVNRAKAVNAAVRDYIKTCNIAGLLTAEQSKKIKKMGLTPSDVKLKPLTDKFQYKYIQMYAYTETNDFVEFELFRVSWSYSEKKRAV